MNFSHLKKLYLHKRGMESGPRQIHTYTYSEANNQTNEAPQKSVKYQINFSTFIVRYRKIVAEEKITIFIFFRFFFSFSFQFQSDEEKERRSGDRRRRKSDMMRTKETFVSLSCNKRQRHALAHIYFRFAQGTVYILTTSRRCWASLSIGFIFLFSSFTRTHAFVFQFVVIVLYTSVSVCTMLFMFISIENV